MIARHDGRRIDRSTLEYIRKNAIERWLAGEAPQDIIESIGLCHTTIYKWISQYEAGGFEALAATKAPGARARLSEAEQRLVREMIVGKDPRQYGFDFGLWTRVLVADIIRQKFNIEMGVTAVGALLARLEITPQKPLRRAYEQDPEAVRLWRDVEYPRIRSEATSRDAEIIFWDEAGYRLDDQVGRSWGERGSTPVVKVTGKRGRTNSATAMSPQGAFWFEEFSENLNSPKFCEILDRFMITRRRPVILIMDRHPAHVSKFTTAHIESYGDKLQVEFLPGYAPELNPVEYVNHYAKAQGPRKRLPKDRHELSRVVGDVLGSLKGAFAKVRSFFKHPELKYIFS
jgi:transposase